MVFATYSPPPHQRHAYYEAQREEELRRQRNSSPVVAPVYVSQPYVPKTEHEKARIREANRGRNVGLGVIFCAGAVLSVVTHTWIPVVVGVGICMAISQEYESEY